MVSKEPFTSSKTRPPPWTGLHGPRWLAHRWVWGEPTGTCSEVDTSSLRTHLQLGEFHPERQPLISLTPAPEVQPL